MNEFYEFYEFSRGSVDQGSVFCQNAMAANWQIMGEIQLEMIQLI